jgi:hypothetical protein
MSDSENKSWKVGQFILDQDGEPYRTISSTFRISCKVSQDLKDSPWIAVEETVTDYVPMGALDEIEEDRAALRESVKNEVIEQARRVIEDELGQKFGNTSK